jgi:KDO2-lipid IV(A) lauroyltransferase
VNVVELGFTAAWRVIPWLPGPLATAAFNAGADHSVRKGGGGVARLAANLRRVVGPDMPRPEFDALLRQAMRSYLRYYLEAFRLGRRTREQNLTGFHLERGELLGDDVAAGRGAVVTLPHGGNWDAAGAWVAANGWPIVTVAERLRPEGLYRKFLAFRESLGMEIIPDRGGESPLHALEERLRKGYIVPLLGDRDLPGRGVEVDFFGAKATMPPGPALLALRTGAPLYVADMWFEPGRPEGYLHGPLPLPGPEQGTMDQRVRRLTQQIADRFAAGIAKHPADWHMLARMWRDPVTTRTAG